MLCILLKKLRIIITLFLNKTTILTKKEVTMPPLFSIMLAITLLAVTPFFSMAHTEHDKARFVSPNGRDAGKCNNAIRPCKSISYAAEKANKGDKILVASGSYTLDNEDDIFLFTNGLVQINGGYNRFDHFQNHNPSANITTLVGIPSTIRKQIEKMGFTVAVDGKQANHREKISNQRIKENLARINYMSNAHGARECVNNLAGSFSCDNIDLLSHMPLSTFSTSPTAKNDLFEVSNSNHDMYFFFYLIFLPS